MSDDGVAKFCNRTTASCGVNDSSKAPPSRKEYFTWDSVTVMKSVKRSAIAVQIMTSGKCHYCISRVVQSV